MGNETATAEEITEQIERVAIYPEFPDSLGIDRYIPQKERDAIDKEDFAWPDAPDGPKYPCDTQEHVNSCAKLLGHAPENKQSSIKSRAKSIAKRKGFAIPDSWQEDDKPTNKSTEADILRTMPSELHIFAPIERINKAKREVTLRATSEAKDSYDTVIDYNGSKDAFSKWRGNIREMHQNIAVGRAVKVDPLDNAKAIDITLRVSKGAEDTWQKVLDGTLIGGSIGARKGKWGQREINGETVPVLERYELVEVSLVDNPSNPDCNISVIRADGIATEVLEPESEATPTETTTATTRAGARFSADTQKKVHSARDHMLQAAKDQMDNCGCEECAGGSKHFDPDGDGDIDFIPSLDKDGDGMGGDGSGTGSDRAMAALITRILTQVLPVELSKQINRSIAPHIQRLSGTTARLAQTDTQQQSNDIERRLDSIESKFSGLDEVRSLVNEVRDLTKRIADQPQQPQPFVNTSAAQNTTNVNPALLRMFQPDPNQQQEQPSLAELARSGRHDRQQQVDGLVSFLQGSNGNRR